MAPGGALNGPANGSLEVDGYWQPWCCTRGSPSNVFLSPLPSPTRGPSAVVSNQVRANDFKPSIIVITGHLFASPTKRIATISATTSVCAQMVNAKRSAERLVVSFGGCIVCCVASWDGDAFVGAGGVGGVVVLGSMDTRLARTATWAAARPPLRPVWDAKAHFFLASNRRLC